MNIQNQLSLANKIYPNFEEALRLCNHGGYSNEKLTEVVVKKNIAFRKNIKASNLAISCHHNPAPDLVKRNFFTPS